VRYCGNRWTKGFGFSIVEGANARPCSRLQRRARLFTKSGRARGQIFFDPRSPEETRLRRFFVGCLSQRGSRARLTEVGAGETSCDSLWQRCAGADGPWSIGKVAGIYDRDGKAIVVDSVGRRFGRSRPAARIMKRFDVQYFQCVGCGRWCRRRSRTWVRRRVRGGLERHGTWVSWGAQPVLRGKKRNPGRACGVLQSRRPVHRLRRVDQGLFVRLMAEMLGLDFRWTDKYAINTFR